MEIKGHLNDVTFHFIPKEQTKMSKNTRSKHVFQQEQDAVQSKNETEMDTMTMGDMSLEKAERLHNKQPAQGLN